VKIGPELCSLWQLSRLAFCIRSFPITGCRSRSSHRSEIRGRFAGRDGRVLRNQQHCDPHHALRSVSRNAPKRVARSARALR
jgi:hypothetical protein